jgi:hypothetical protein
MQYKMPRQKISPRLARFGLGKIKEQEHYVPKLTKKLLSQIALVCEEICKAGIPSYLVVMKLKGKLGHGVFLRPDAKPILKGEIIAPYSGNVYIAQQNHGQGSDYAFSLVSDIALTKEEHALFDPKSKYHPRRLYSIDLDAEKEGNFTRFINHSAKPNVEAQMMRIPKNGLGLKSAHFEIIYTAKKKILPGEQLLICYEGEDKSYWGALNIKPFPMTPQTFKLPNC